MLSIDTSVSLNIDTEGTRSINTFLILLLDTVIDIKKIRPCDLWYTIGYIATDGYLSVDGRHINITSKDKEHLFKIKEALYIENKIGRKSRTNGGEKRFSQLQFGDVRFFRYLVTIGLTSRKSLTIGPLRIDDSFFADFLRGIIDGDGNITTWVHKTNYHRQWCLRIYSASLRFIKWLKDKIDEEISVKGRLHSKDIVNSNNPIYCLKFGKLAAMKIFKKIYYNDCLSLERKFLQAQLCLQESTKMVN